MGWLMTKKKYNVLRNEPNKNDIMKKIWSLILLLLLLPYTGEARKKVLFIGDSITDAGWGRSGGSPKPTSERNLTDLNHIYGHGFMFLCAAHYQSEYPEADYEFFNRGISGDTLEKLEKRWKTDALDIQPDVLTLLVGINDVYDFLRDCEGDFDFSAWEQRYRALLDSSLAANPELKLVLGAPFIANVGSMRKKTDYAKREALVKGCAEVVKRIAEDYKAVYLPFDKLFEKLNTETPESRSTYWIWDGVHPTAAGHQRMANLWIKAVDKKRWLK